MKRYLPLLLLAIGVLLPCYSLSQTEVRGGLRLQLQAPVVHWLQFGQGSGAGAWVTRPISTQSSLRFAIGYQHFSGYQNGLVTINEISAPFEYLRTMQNIQLDGMTFFSAGIAYNYHLPDSRWSFGAGIRLSKLISSEGFQQNHERYLVYRITTNPFTNPLNVDIDHDFQTSSRTYVASTLNEEQLNLNDFGLTMTLRYKLLEGLAAEAGIYQGFINRWSASYADLKKLRITSFTLGLSARIF